MILFLPEEYMFQLVYIHSNTGTVRIFNIFIVIFNMRLLMINEVENLFICFLAILLSSFAKCLSFSHFNCMVCLVLLIYRSSACNLEGSVSLLWLNTIWPPSSLLLAGSEMLWHLPGFFFPCKIKFSTEISSFAEAFMSLNIL